MSDAPVRAGGIPLVEADRDVLFDMAGVRRAEALGGYENLVFRSLDPPGRIVRVTHTSRRSVAHVRAEAALLHILDSEGVGVAAPVEAAPVFERRLETGDTVVCLVTRSAPGAQRSADRWDENTMAAYGRLMGRFHRVSRTHPGLASLERPQWNDPTMLTFESDLAGADADALAYGRETLTRIESATADGPSLLIHQDAHLANLHITEEDEITLFDWDDAAYGPVEYDLAMIVFYWTAGRSLDDPLSDTRRLLDAFLPAYQGEAGSTAVDVELLDLYLTYRELDIYAALTGSQGKDPWARAFMTGRAERIAARTPFLGIPFAEL